MISVGVGASIVAITEAIKRIVPQVSGIVTIIVAAGLGLAAGFAKIDGLNWLTGLTTGLTAVAGVTVATKIGENK